MDEQMNAYVILFRLKEKGTNSNELQTKMNEFPDWAYLRGDTYLVLTSDDIKAITQKIDQFIQKDEACLVALIDKSVAWKGFGNQVDLWLTSNLSNNGNK